MGDPCDCDFGEPDGFDDLTLKFRSQELVAALELGMLMGDEHVELVVSGVLLDGTPFVGSDCIRLVPPNSGPDRMSSFWGGPSAQGFSP